MRCPKSRFPIRIIVFDELELIIFVSQGLTLSTASLHSSDLLMLMLVTGPCPSSRPSHDFPVLKKMLKRYVVVTIFIFHRGITKAELSCETETEDVQTIR